MPFPRFAVCATATVLLACHPAPAVRLPSPSPAAWVPSLGPEALCRPGEFVLLGVAWDESTGKPLQDAIIRLSDSPVRGAASDRTGRYVLPRLGPGLHEVVATRIGYYTEARRIVLPGVDGIRRNDSSLQDAPCTPEVLHFYFRPARVAFRRVDMPNAASPQCGFFFEFDRVVNGLTKSQRPNHALQGTKGFA